MNVLELTGFGVEVGVEYGLFSEEILDGSALHVLFSVDAWQVYVEDDGGAKKTQEQHEKSYADARARLARFGPRSKILRLPSMAAAGLFCDGELDFVYIDANHSYESCSADIKAWYPKVRVGGVFSGHDYDCFEGVSRAVNEFAAEAGISFEVLRRGGPPSWWFVRKGA